MGKLIVFNLITLDGYFAGPKGEIHWHNAGDPEFNAFATEQIGKGTSVSVWSKNI